MGPGSEDDEWETVEPLQEGSEPSKAPLLPGGPPERAVGPAEPAHRRRVTGERQRRRPALGTVLQWPLLLFYVP